MRCPTPHVVILLLCLLLSLSTLPGYAERPNRATISFSGLPGPDCIPGTADDIPFTSADTMWTSPGGARIIDEEYAAVGVHFSGSGTIMTFGGGWNPDGSPGPGTQYALVNIHLTNEATETHTGIAPLIVRFDIPQWRITFDLLDFINSSGTSNPVILRDANGNVIATRTLTCADAILGGTNPNQLAGRFTLQPGRKFTEVEFGLTGPNNGGFCLDNLEYKMLPEPGSLLALSLGLSGLVASRIRRRPRA